MYLALPLCWIMSVTGECWSGGGAAYSVASLCRIMTSLLKMTSLTPETDSKTASSSPSRHLGLIWHLAHTELLTSDPWPTAFCLPPGHPYPVPSSVHFLEPLPSPWVRPQGWHEQWTYVVPPVRRLGWGLASHRAVNVRGWLGLMVARCWRKMYIF